jgi:uncharacterized tellurite resistance protein B-like protein
MMVAMADGKLDGQELEAIAHQLGATLRAIPEDRLEALSTMAIAQARKLGVETAVDLLAHQIPDHQDRLDAVRFAIDIAYADGFGHALEMHRVTAIAARLGLSEEEFAATLKAHNAAKGRR